MAHLLRIPLLVLIAAAAPLAAAAQNAPRWTPTPAIEAEVRAELARRWSTEPAAVAIEWGTLAGAVPADSRTTVENGAGSSWLVAFRDADGRQTGSVRARVGTHAIDFVAARDIARGEAIGEDDMVQRPGIAWGPPADPAAAPEGWVARRRINAGEPLVAPAVSAPDMVRAGDQVRLTVEQGGVVLTASAVALASGPLGARVSVRTDGGRRIETLVTGPGEVRIRGSER